MNVTILSLVFDFILLLLLIVTIAYAARLSLALKRFRENRELLDSTIKELNKNVSDAEQIIGKIKNTAATSGDELQKTIDKANALADELSLMTESGDNLANRLEKLASRATAHKSDMAADDMAALDRSAPMPSSKGKSTVRGKSDGRAGASKKDISESEAKKEAESFLERVFSIRDPDVERGGNPLENIAPLDEAEDDYHSEAERDLLKALQGKDKG